MHHLKDARPVDLRHVVESGKRAAVLHLRHSHGCYRWTGDGRCVDCNRYTGTPPGAFRRVVEGGNEYHLPPDARPRSFYDRLVGA
jgi:hypothetical protein